MGNICGDSSNAPITCAYDTTSKSSASNGDEDAAEEVLPNEVVTKDKTGEADDSTA